MSIFAAFLAGCSQAEQKKINSPEPAPPSAASPKTTDGVDPDSVELVFSLQFDRDVYEESDWGEPPQLAVWLEDDSHQTIRTVWVTYRTASGDWAGKVECPIALPYWVSRYNNEYKTPGPPTFLDPAPDAVTGATPQNQPFQITTRVKKGSRWSCFLEVNCSGDFNRAFPSIRDDGSPDPNGNGQPSIIFRADITAQPKKKASFALIGRTDQFQPVDSIIENLDGITSAQHLLSKIEVLCR